MGEIAEPIAGPRKIIHIGVGRPITSVQTDSGVMPPKMNWEQIAQLPVVSEVPTPVPGEIRVDAWQSAVDNAFQQGDYETVTTLEIVRPDITPSSHAVSVKTTELVATRPTSWSSEIVSVRGVASVNEENPVFADEFDKLLAKFGQETRVLDQLKEFIHATGYTPSPDQVRSKYQSILRGQHLGQFSEADLINDILELTRISPDASVFQEAIRPGHVEYVRGLATRFGVEITVEMIQTSYQRIFEERGRIDPEFIKEIGVAPREDIVQSTYTKLIIDRRIEDVTRLQQATGIAPQFAPDQIQPIYTSYLDSSHLYEQDFERLKKLVEATGIAPGSELVQRAALRQIKGWGGTHSGIREQLRKLEQSTGVSVEIPQTAIQQLYKDVITAKNYEAVLVIHKEFGIKPEIDVEDARQFMVQMMDHTDKNTMINLQTVLGIEFQATPEEISARYQEKLQNLEFYGVDRIREFTGVLPDQEALQQAFERYARKRFGEQSSYRDWSDDFKQMIDRYGVSISEPLATSLYEQCVSMGTIDTTKIERLNNLLGRRLSADLAQRAYSQLLTSESFSAGSTFERIYQLSGDVKPEVPEEQIQAYYMRCLGRSFVDTESIQKVVGVTGVSPQFDAQNINALYRYVLQQGGAYRIDKIQQFTGVSLVIDEEIQSIATQRLQDELIKIAQGKYEWSSSDADEIKKLIEVTGVRPDVQQVQSYYEELLTEAPDNWELKIDKIVAATGIAPTFSPDQIRERAEQMLKNGQTRNLGRLAKYGQLILESEAVEEGYAVVLGSIKGKDSRYEENWLDRFQKIYKLTGVLPTEEQLGKIIIQLAQDRQYNSGRSHSPITQALEMAEKSFEIKASEALVEEIYSGLFQQGDLRSISNLREKTGIVPQIAPELVQVKVDAAIKAKSLQELYEIKGTLGIDKLPVTDEVLQETYRSLADSPDFGSKYRAEILTRYFYKLYDLTGIQARLTPEQLARGYGGVIASSYDGSYSEFERAVGVPPTESDLQQQIYRWLSDDYLDHVKDRIVQFRDRHNLRISVDIVEAAEIHRLEKTRLSNIKETIEYFRKAEEITGVQVKLPQEVVDAHVTRMIMGHEPTEISCTEIDDLFLWYESYVGSLPSASLVNLAYSRTFNQTISYSDDLKKTTGGYLQVWDWLKEKYGLPNEETIQTVYLRLLDQEGFGLAISTAQLEEFSGVAPDISKMEEIARLSNPDLKRGDIESHLQKIVLKDIVLGQYDNAAKLKKQFGLKITLDPTEIQVAYAKVLLGTHEQKKAMYEYLLEVSGVSPSPEIIQACYRELFEGDQFRPENVAAFQEIVKTPPSKEVIQAKYKELFRKYVQTYEPAYDEDDHENTGEYFLGQLTELAQSTGIAPQLDREFVMSMYEYCVSHREVYHPKLAVIARLTGVEIDKEFIQQHILDNASFTSAVPFSISTEQLEEHFAKAENTSLAEYKRVYTIFGCYDYYQTVLTRLEQEGTPEAKQKMVSILGAMGTRDIKDAERYNQIKARILEFGKEGNRRIDKRVAEALAELSRAGDTELTSQLVDIIRKRSTGKEVEESRRLLGFTEEQEIALRALTQLDNSTSNEALLVLLFTPDIDPHVKTIIARNLAETKKYFFPDRIKEWVNTLVKEESKTVNWDDLKFFHSALRIPSADIRKKSIRQIDDAITMFTDAGLSVAKTHQEVCPAVPENVFMQLWSFTRGNRALMVKFNQLYQVTKGTAQQDALLFGIANILTVNKGVRVKILRQLERIDFASRDSGSQMANMLKTMAFLDTVERQLGSGKSDMSGMLDILDTPVESLDQLNTSLKVIVVEKIKEVLPNEDIDADKIQALWEQWGSLEPLFVYAGKMASSHYDGTLQLVADMVPRFDPPDYTGWKEWRYNVENKRVRSQIGHLSSGQLEVWRSDHFAELGDILIATSPTDRSKQIVSQLGLALSDKHIYNPEIDVSSKHRFIQERLELTYGLITQTPEQREEILTGEIKGLQDDIEIIDSITRFSSIPRIQQALSMFGEAQTVAVNKRVEDTIIFLSQFLTKEQSQEMQTAVGVAKQSGAASVTASSLLSAKARQALETKVKEIETAYQKALDSDIFGRYGLDKSQIKNLGQFYQKRQELKTLVDLYRLSKLTPRLIATNRIEERTDKRGETISQVIEGLRKYFKDNPTFLQDIDNINSTITHREEIGANRRLAMIITDNPQMLFQVGKYPIGCGSCQNYEGSPDWNRALAAYVADAHIKAMFLVDLSKLPMAIRQEIEARGLDSVRGSISAQDMLEASVARSMIKLVKTDDGQPALFIEPTYTVINKGDLSMNRYFDIFAELIIAEPMGIRLTRGGGQAIVDVPTSRNPSGQYEDAAAGNAGHGGMGIQTGSYTMSAKFIDKFTPATEEDRRVAEMISQSEE